MGEDGNTHGKVLRHEIGGILSTLWPFSPLGLQCGFVPYLKRLQF